MNSKENIVKELFRLYSKDIRNYAASILKDSFDAEDALQEVFYSFLNSFQSFKGECSYKTYLLVITRNYCYNKITRRKKNIFPIEENTFISVEPRLEDKITLKDAIKRLNHEEYEIIYLREYACHSYQEIAEILGISVENVKIRLFRIRKQLRDYLK